MTEWGELWAYPAPAVVAGIAGGIIGVAGARRSSTTTDVLVYFAAGAFLGLVFLHLLPESGERAGWGPALVAFVLGWLACLLITRRSGATCPACAGDPPRSRALPVGGLLIFTVALHSALDGFALSSAGRDPHAAELVSLAVLVHKVPEGVAVAALLRGSGRSVPAALLITSLVECMTFGGFALGLLLGEQQALLLGLGLGFVAGSFVYFIAITLRHLREAVHPRLNAASAAFGVLVVFLAQLTSNHPH